jgi:menaquinone-dependent protoporphyrinogen oxidase
MNVLVTYASRHGSTAEIAERIGTGLAAAGLVVEVKPVTQVRDVTPYDAVVIGAAAYLFHWMKEASTFVKRHRIDLRQRPVWIFSSGPLGEEKVDEEGRDVLEAARPKEFPELREAVQPRGEEVFFGAWDPSAPAVGLAERVVRRMPAARDALPAGDFRDWAAIDAWAAQIAADLSAEAAS